MKKIYAILLMGGLLFSNSACESDATLDETRPATVELPSVSLGNVTLNKTEVTFEVSLNGLGNPAAREYGVLVSTEEQPGLENSTAIAADMAEATATLSGSFSPGTTYYACAYALTTNELVTSEVKSFTTESHYLGAILGEKVLNGYNYHADGEYPIAVTITADEEDETVAYMSGLYSFALPAGYELNLTPIKMVFDLEAGTVTIPGEQITSDNQWGSYAYSFVDAEGYIVYEDNVGTIENDVISFSCLGAFIIEGQNSGLPHFLYYDMTIQ